MLVRRRAVLLLVTGLVASLLVAAPVVARSSALFALDGTFKQETVYSYTVTATPEGSAPVTITLPLPQGWEQTGHSEKILSLTVDAVPEPSTRWDKKDRWGNVWQTLRWMRPGSEVQAIRRAVVETSTEYGPIVTSSPYPVDRRKLPWEASNWLWQDQSVQSGHPEIRELATTLVRGCRTQLEAVIKIINWVRANAEYSCARDLCEPVLRIDALFTLQNLKGNCVNFANLAMALLRAAGIPARPVNGFVADRKDSFAAHAWVSVYFPDLGWMDFESSNWMPAYGEVPKTFLLPQHISLYRGEGEGVCNARFDEVHNVEFTVLSHPDRSTALVAEVLPGQAVSWVITVHNGSVEPLTYNLVPEDVPAGWYASTTETVLAIDPNGASTTWDTLLTVKPPDGATPGEGATVRLTCLSGGVKLGEITATVRVIGKP